METQFKFILILSILLLSSFMKQTDKTFKFHKLVSIKRDMKDLPNSDDPLVVRTYFENDSEWKMISSKLISTNEMGFRAYLEFIDNKEFSNASTTDIVQVAAKNYKHSFIFLADKITFENSESSLLCLDLYDEVGRFFRVIPSELWAVQSNLSIANMDFNEFFENCDEDGVFRGFK